MLRAGCVAVNTPKVENPSVKRAVVGESEQAGTARPAQCESISAWMAGTLEAIERQHGFARSSLLLALAAPPRSIRRAFAGTQRGLRAEVLAAYFARWVDSDPLACEAAREMFERHGFVRTTALYGELDGACRRFVDDFLRSIDVVDQLSLRLAGNGTTDGYLTIHATEPISQSDQGGLVALTSQLTEELRSYLPTGLRGQFSPRERQAAELVALGFSNQQIAGILHIGPDTVKKHVSGTMKKLHLQRRTQLAVSWTTGRVIALPTDTSATN